MSSLLTLTFLPLSLCACNFAQIGEGDTCTDKWSNLVNVLHPTQQAVGYGWIARKLGKDFTSAKKSQSTMDDNGDTPVVVGPNNVPYIVDDHHTLSALEYSGYSDTTVTCRIVCNWASFNGTMASFYDKMREENLLLGIGRPSNEPNTLPVLIDPATIGAKVGTLPDDPWRSLAGYARKIQDPSCPSSTKYCLRAYDRECNPLSGSATPFFEFRWSYFMNLAFEDTSLWDQPASAATFKALYQQLSPPSKGPSSEDPAEWQKAADTLLPLCRGTAAGNYRLPEALKSPFANAYLPGYVAGVTTKLDHDDPDCAIPGCPTNSPTDAATL